MPGFGVCHRLAAAVADDELRDAKFHDIKLKRLLHGELPQFVVRAGGVFYIEQSAKRLRVKS